MRSALAVDVGQADRGDLHAVVAGEARDHLIDRRLGRVVGKLAVQQGGAQWHILAVRRIRGGPVRLQGGGEDDLTDRRRATGVEQVARALDVDLDRLRGGRVAVADVGLRRQVEDRVASRQDGREALGIAQIDLDHLRLAVHAEQLKTRPVSRRASPPRPGPSEHPHLAPGLEQTRDQM